MNKIISVADLLKLLGMFMTVAAVWLQLNIQVAKLEARVSSLEKENNKKELILEQILKETKEINNRLIKLETYYENDKDK